MFVDLQIITQRINNSKESLEKIVSTNNYIGFHPIAEELILDIKSLFLFSKIYLDYLIRCIVEDFFSKISNLNKKSFHRHILRLKNLEVIDTKFVQYKEYMMQNGFRILYRIVNVRNKFVDHIKAVRVESLAFTEDFTECSVVIKILKNYYPDYIIDPFLKRARFDKKLKESILNFAKEKDITFPEFKQKHDNDFIYLNKILEDLELKYNILEEKKEFEHYHNKLLRFREALGVVMNDKGIYEMIKDFTNDLGNILGKPYD